ncbi:exonuclease subunit SbcD [Vibrio algicola]|uniref:Nuclease SbcCD subunit D n=1 Tax=Vibrio algicola TaxID=2662262 RepID=A0A5Q0TGL6_9VIBR|nr:exonuclease subunit SbcD [Vibrio algicola]
MKILHTSDWHLGQNFFSKSRKREHQKFLQWLLELVEKQSIDTIIVAGDVFDTGSPPSYAREMYNQFVVDVHKTGCTLVVLGGNHDSVSMLNESKELLACLNTHVIANSNEDLTSQVLTLKTQSGEVGAILCAVPFVRPRDVVQSLAGETSVDKKQSLGHAIKQHYHQLYQYAEQVRDSLDAQLPIVATGHLTAVGVTASESVRDIYIGSLEAFDAGAFPPVDYMALGHIHRPQIVAKSESIRYCGSPIPLSFDEIKGFDEIKSIEQAEAGTQTRQRIQIANKQVVVVEFDNNQKKITPTSIPIFQAMAVIKGDLQQIEQQLQQFTQVKDTVWLCIHVEVQDYLSDLQARIQSLVEGLNVEVLQLRRTRSQQAKALTQMQNETLAELSPQDVFAKRLQLETFETEIEQQRKARILDHFKVVLSEVELKDLPENDAVMPQGDVK